MNGVIQKKKNSQSELPRLLFVFECIVVIKSVHDEIADWKYYIKVNKIISWSHIDWDSNNTGSGCHYKLQAHCNKIWMLYLQVAITSQVQHPKHLEPLDSRTMLS